MPINLKYSDPALWIERNKFIERLKRVIPYCEITGKTSNLSVHEFLCPYSKKYKPEVNQLFMLHPGNCIVLNNDLHINNKPMKDKCIFAVSKRRLDACREFGFANGQRMLEDFCQKVVKLKQDGLIKILPEQILYYAKEKQSSNTPA